MYIGSNEHKELFCRLRAIPIWTMALEVEIGAGDMLAGFAKTVSDPATFVRACAEENERYMAGFDARLLRPRFIPELAKFALSILDTIDLVRAAFAKSAPCSTSQQRS